MAFLIVDCNSFYVACERAFDARLVGRPVVVLSNNDGCVVSRSLEAKRAGVPMGAPAFKCRKLFEQHGVIALSSNYTLYADMSQRVMETLARFTDRLEIYSIDEAFLPRDFPEGWSEARGWRDAVELARDIRQTVRRWTGIPVSIGVASTRTLAKLANRRAKRDPETEGVFCFDAAPYPDQLLAGTEVEDIWGIGRRRGAALRQHGIATALDLREAPSRWVLHRFTVAGMRTQRELRREPCIEPDMVPETRHSITCSRSFGRSVTDVAELREAVACFIEHAAEKLRAQRSLAGMVLVYLCTNRHRADLPQRSPSGTATLPVASAYTPELAAAAHGVLDSLYAPGYAYAKAGVLLCDLRPEGSRQLALFDERAADPREWERQSRLMAAVDDLNRRFGRGKVALGSCGIERAWRGRQESRTPHYTTSWEELFTVS